jgi:hypothetical protein
MSRKQLLILWILTLVAGLIVFKTKNDKDDKITVSTKLEIGAETLGDIDLGKITEVAVTAGDDTTTAVLKENRWFVSEEGNFPVNLQTLSGIFDDLQKARVIQATSIEKDYYDRFHLDPEDEKTDNRPKTITLKSGEDTLITYYIGKRNETKGGRGSGSGRYIRLSNDDSGVYVIKEGFDNLQAKPEDWITKSLTLLDSPIKVEVKAKEGASYESWTVSRPTAVDDFTLEDGTAGWETNSTEAMALKNFFTQVNFTDLLNEQEVKDLVNENDQREVNITDSSGAKYLFTITPEKVEQPEKKPDDKAPPAKVEPSSFVVSFKILSGPTEPKKPAADATVQQQAEYQARVANRDKLIRNMELQKTLEGRNFKIAATHIKAINKRKQELEKAKKVSVTTKPVKVPTPGPVTDTPSPFINPPPIPGSTPAPKNGKPPRKRIEAVTPPIAIPPRPGNKEKEVKPAETTEKKDAAKKEAPEKSE